MREARAMIRAMRCRLMILMPRRHADAAPLCLYAAADTLIRVIVTRITLMLTPRQRRYAMPRAAYASRFRHALCYKICCR